MTAQDTSSHINSLLSPRSIALSGASHNPETAGSYILRNIVFSGYREKFFPIHPKVNELYGYDTYPSFQSVKDEIDLAVIASPIDTVINDIFDCTRAKVKNICITTTGFAETGNIGLTLQKKIKKLAGDHGIRLLGPGSLGVILPQKKLNASIAPALPLPGRTAFLSQSGAFINALIEYSLYYDLGFSEIIGLGNKADISEVDFLEYYLSIREDGRPNVIGSYLENIGDGKRFVEIVQHLTKKIPFITLIPASKKTAEFAYEHTGSITQKEDVIRTALDQCGVVRAETQQELFDFLLAFSWQSLPRGNHIALVSNAGGGLVVAVEQVYKHGLKLVHFSSDVKRLLARDAQIIHKQNGVVDLGGEALSLNYLHILDSVLGDHDVNAVVVILSPQVMTQIEESAEVIGKLARSHGKTVIATFMGYEEVDKGIRALGKYFVPAFNTPQRAIKALSVMYEYHKWRERGENFKSQYSFEKRHYKEKPDKINDILEHARIHKIMKLDLEECITILKTYGIPQNHIKSVKGQKDILHYGDTLGYPMKFLCSNQRKRWEVKDSRHARSFYKSHFTKQSSGDKHADTAHFVRKKYQGKNTFSITLEKDTYYEFLSRGWNVRELGKLSFGYHFVLEFGGTLVKRKIESLLPLSRQYLENALISSGFFTELGLKSGERFDTLCRSALSLIQNLSHIVLDFEQILAFGVQCIVDGKKILVVDSEITIDLMR